MRDRTTIFLALMACATTASAGEGQALPHDWAVPSARFILQLGVLVFAAKMGGLLFHRWKVSRVVGEVAAGLLLAPSLLGGLALPFFPDGLMSDAASWFSPGGPMYGIISLALVVFFFLAGLDTDVRQLKQATAGGIATGLAGFALCFTPLLFFCAVPSPGQNGADPGMWLFCVVMATSSVGMLARMLAARQRLESPAGTVALTAALADNVAGLFLFTVFSGAYAAARLGARVDAYLLASMAVRTLLGCAVIALCGLPIARWVNGLALRERAYPLAFAVAAACLLVAAGAAGAMGLPALAGAYVTGLVFATTDLRYEIRERLDFFSAVLVPACFAALGMLIDPRLLMSGGACAYLGVFMAVAVATKGLGNAAAAWLFAGLNRTGCLRVSAALLPRGELTLALLAAAVCMGALPEAAGNALLPELLLVALTCLCGPRLVEPLFARGGSGTRKPSEAPEPVKLVYQFSSHQAAMLMINRAVEIFEDDGFYAHRLNRYQAHYRVSRAGQAVHLSAEAGTVTIECSERERSLINAVMLELSSGVEQSLRELQKPLDDVLLRKNLQRAAPASAAAVASSMLKNRFAAETLKPRLLATTKQGAISELVSLLYENGLVMDRERAVQTVFGREQGLSTGLEHGLAIPHARTDAVSRLVCAIGLKKEGLDFDAADGKPTRIVVLVLAPDNASAPQLQLIAQVCRQLDEKGRAALLACETAEDMFAVLTGGPAAPLPGGKPADAPLAAVLQWQSVSLDLSPADQGQALSLLLALCARSGAVGAMEELRKELETGGPLMPERIGEDTALFAVETPNVFRAVAALGVSAQGVSCVCGGRRRVCVLLLYPPSAASGIGRVKEALAHALDAEGLAALLASKTSKEALDVLTR
jgi:Kef-type K+ transport system membrane component KefB/mannitol/fructose-specific phosphotransferase system IIA component (Ntr-type)